MSCCDFDAQGANRFLKKMDSCFEHNDMRAAKETIEFWENEARSKGDDRLLLTVLNEAMGVYRRTQKKTKALNAMDESLKLIDKLDLQNNLSGATIYINSATTLSFCDRKEEGLELYDKAANCYELAGKKETYEYATLLNNKASTLYELKRYDEAEKNIKEAIDAWIWACKTHGTLDAALAECGVPLLRREGIKNYAASILPSQKEKSTCPA